MTELQFEHHEEPNQAIHTARMSDEEAKAVIDLWARKRTEAEQVATLPSVRDVAAGLEIPPEEAYRLLQEVRARQELNQPVTQHLAVTGRYRTHNRSAVAALIAATGAAMLLALLTIRAFRQVSHAAAPTAISIPTPLEAQPERAAEDLDRSIREHNPSGLERTTRELNPVSTEPRSAGDPAPSDIPPPQAAPVR